MKKKRNFIFKQALIFFDLLAILIGVFSCFNSRKFFSERDNCFNKILTKDEIIDV
jgi:hypothetical protein